MKKETIIQAIIWVGYTVFILFAIFSIWNK